MKHEDIFSEDSLTQSIIQLKCICKLLSRLQLQTTTTSKLGINSLIYLELPLENKDIKIVTQTDLLGWWSVVSTSGIYVQCGLKVEIQKSHRRMFTPLLKLYISISRNMN